jgi:hypothetical protein
MAATKDGLSPNGGGGLFRLRNRKWTLPANRPLASERSPEEAQTFKPIGASVPKGCRHNPLSFRCRFTALKRWLRLSRGHTPRFGLERSTHGAEKLRLKTPIRYLFLRPRILAISAAVSSTNRFISSPCSGLPGWGNFSSPSGVINEGAFLSSCRGVTPNSGGKVS